MLESEFGESTNGIRQELNRFEEAGMLTSFVVGNKKMFQANTSHPLFNDIQNIILKYVGIDRIVETVINRLGNLEAVYLTGAYARGQDQGIIDLIFIGEVNRNYLIQLAEKAEELIGRKIRFLVYRLDEKKKFQPPEDHLIIWNK